MIIHSLGNDDPRLGIKSLRKIGLKTAHLGNWTWKHCHIVAEGLASNYTCPILAELECTKSSQ